MKPSVSKYGIFVHTTGRASKYFCKISASSAGGCENKFSSSGGRAISAGIPPSTIDAITFRKTACPPEWILGHFSIAAGNFSKQKISE
jgi:hypothetical protein